MLAHAPPPCPCRIAAESDVPEQTLPPVGCVDAHAAKRVLSPTANRGRGLLAALLDVRPDELLGVLFEHLVDLVQDRVHVIGQLLVPLLGFLGGGGLLVLRLLGPARRLPLAATVLARRHLRYLRSLRGTAPSTAQRYRRHRQSRPILHSGITLGN